MFIVKISLMKHFVILLFSIVFLSSCGNGKPAEEEVIVSKNVVIKADTTNTDTIKIQSRKPLSPPKDDGTATANSIVERAKAKKL